MTRETEATKNMVLRLNPELADQLRAVADVEGRTVSDVVREAVQELVTRRRKDRRFMRLLEENLRRHERVLRSLQEDER